MTGKDASGGRPRAGKWKKRLPLIFGALVVLGVCVAVRYFWGPESASAQAPVVRGQTRAASYSGRLERPVANQVSPAAPQAAAAAAPVVDASQLKVMAVVNGEQVGRQHLAQECLRRYGETVLESMVNKHLIWQACQQRGITITEQDVENEIDATAAKFRLSKDRYLQMLQEERDISPDHYRRELVWPMLALRRLAAKQIEVSSEELREAYESEYGAKVKTRMISVRSRKKADELRALAAANPDSFGDLAKDHSEDSSSASVRGLIPPIRKHLGDANLERIAFGLKVGEISPAIQVADQYLILKCEEHLPPTLLAAEHIAQAEAQLKGRIRDQKLRTAAADQFRALQDQAEVVNYINDPQRRQQYPGVAATINGRQITVRELSEECMRRHGEEVLEGEINRLLLTQALSRRNRAVAEGDIDAEMARAALSYGYQTPDGAADIQKWLEYVTEGDPSKVDLYVRDAVWPTVALKKLVTETVSVTDEDMQKGFESNYGPRVEVLAIVLGNQRQAQSVWEMARNNPSDQFFGELAQQYSIEPVSRANTGKVPPIRRYGGQPLVEKEAFALNPGDLSGIIAVGDKYVILRCLGRTKPVVEKMNDVVRDELYKDIHEKKLRLAMSEEFDRMQEAAQIDNFLTGASQAGSQGKSRSASQPTAGPRR